MNENWDLICKIEHLLKELLYQDDTIICTYRCVTFNQMESLDRKNRIFQERSYSPFKIGISLLVEIRLIKLETDSRFSNCLKKINIFSEL